MSRKRGSVSMVAAAVLVSGLFIGKAEAIPTLQLDIVGGTYDTSTETIVSSGSSFVLYAYLLANRTNTIDDTYFVSMAVTPKLDVPSDLGSFVVNGTTVVDVTGDMTYGTPPIETYLGSTAATDSGDLASHSIYETYFYEYSFQFNSSSTTVAYNTQDDAGAGPASSAGSMYYKSFSIDTSGLDAGYQIHFDLYNTALARRSTTDLDVTQFAPFSHDAESASNHQVPEPGTLLLLGSGLLGLGILRRTKTCN